MRHEHVYCKGCGFNTIFPDLCPCPDDPEEPTMTDNHPNLALQLSLLAWRNMEQFIEGGYEPDTLLAICKNNIAVLKELKESK